MSPDSHSDARQFPHAYFCVVGAIAYILFVGLLLHLTLVRVDLSPHTPHLSSWDGNKMIPCTGK